jgi:glycosyltransferase involved in cell wall biosynthesis
MKVALVHDWLVTFRGGEKVLEAMAELYPEADIFTLLHERGTMPATLEQRRIVTSLLDRLPAARSRHRYFLPLFPAAIEQLDLSGYELLLSSSHCVAKGVRADRGARHLSYVHAPMRYMWDRFDAYFGQGRSSPWVSAAARLVRPYLQRWDVRSAARVDRFVANSHYIARKIALLYGRQASVVYPPVELERFTQLPFEGSGRGDYFLWFGALAPYKRVDLAIEAFRQLERPLWIVGSGQEDQRVRRQLPHNVKLLGQVPDVELPAILRDARALVFTAEEDFGISPIEVQACGRPVIAFGAGGCLETVTSKTGLFFPEQTVDSLRRAVEAFDAWEATFEPKSARENAQRFSKQAFHQGLQREVSLLAR